MWQSDLLEPNDLNFIYRVNLDKILISDGKISDISRKHFLNLIFDNEVGSKKISKENFNSKYKSLLILLNEHEEANDKPKPKTNFNPNANRDIKNYLMEEFINEQSNDMKIHKRVLSEEINSSKIMIGKTLEKEHSEILIPVNINNEISIDPSELFKDINFNDSSYPKKGLSSIVRPTNTFKHDLEFNNNQINYDEKFNKKGLNFEKELDNKYVNSGNIISTGSSGGTTTPYELQNPCLTPPFINYQHNININVNNYGQIDMKSLHNSNSKNKNTININQKLKEVYFELNKPNEKYKIRKESKVYNNKVEDYNKKEYLPVLNSKKEDYFAGFCKNLSNNSSSKNQGLKIISDKILKFPGINREKEQLQKLSNNLSSSYKNTRNNSNKFLDLEIMLKSTPNDFYQNRQTLSTNNFLDKNFDNLEYKLNNLQLLRKNAKNKYPVIEKKFKLGKNINTSSKDLKNFMNYKNNENKKLNTDPTIETSSSRNKCINNLIF